MKPKYSARYWESVFWSREYGQLAELSGLLCSSLAFKLSEPEYGLQRLAFMFVEGLLWFAQSIRSGVWTYFEATPQSRQFALLNALHDCGPPEFASIYRLGMRDWKDVQKIARVDHWIQAHDEENNAWLWSVADAHRTLFESIVEIAPPK